MIDFEKLHIGMLIEIEYKHGTHTERHMIREKAVISDIYYNRSNRLMGKCITLSGMKVSFNPHIDSYFAILDV